MIKKAIILLFLTILLIGCAQQIEPLQPGPSSVERMPVTEPCIPDWQCTEWSECNVHGLQRRRCIDTNQCRLSERPIDTRSCVQPIPELTPVCGPCQYLENNKCKDYACCVDTDCNDYSPDTTDVCIYPGTKKAACVHEQVKPVEEPINDEATAEQCKDNDNFCAWECNSWKLDSDCGIPKIYDFVEHRSHSQYLNSNIVHWDDESWRKYAPLINQVRQLTQGLTNDLEKANAIALWVRNSRPYGFPSPANERKSIIDIFEAPTGICMDAALLTTAMFRIAGIPARAIMPTDSSHEISEAYINGKWIGFDTAFTCFVEQNPNCVSEPFIHAGPLTVFSYDNEFFGTDEVFTESVGGLFLRNINDVKYFKVNVIQRPMYKNVNIRVQLSWNWKNDNEIVDKKCFFAYLGEPETEITNPPVIVSVDRDFILHCSVAFSDYSEQHEIEMGKIKGEDLIVSPYQATDYVDTQISVISKDVDSLGWGEVYYPISSKLLFKNSDGSLSFDYDQNKYADFTGIGEYFRADNLDCDWYSCRYVESNGYSQRLQTVSILGYGSFESNGQKYNTMVPDHHNGYAKILLPEGNYKLVYTVPFEGDFGQASFRVVSGSKTVITPETLERSSTQNKYSLLVSALKESVEGLNP